MAVKKHNHELTNETKGFYDYFYKVTVVNEINLINIGNCPTHHKVGVSLCAILLVFGWVQVSSLICIFLLISHYHRFTNESINKNHEYNFIDLKVHTYICWFYYIKVMDL